jgi:signal transduction histidine kinase
MSDQVIILIGIGRITDGAGNLTEVISRLPRESGLAYVLISPRAPSAEALAATLRDAAPLCVVPQDSPAPLTPDCLHVTTSREVWIADDEITASPDVPPAGSAGDCLRVEVSESVGEATNRRLLSRLISMQEDERRRVARDLHDHVGQQITALRLHLTALAKEHGQPEWDERAATVDDLVARIDHDLATLAWELHPAALDDLGLAPALERFVKEWSAIHDIRTEFLATGPGDPLLASDLKTALYRIVQESLNNIHKHAHADRVSVILRQHDDRIVLIIEDNGVGFDWNSGPSDESGRMGLRSIRERTMLVGGTCIIESEPGRGTTVLVQVPAPGGRKHSVPHTGIAGLR